MDYYQYVNLQDNKKKLNWYESSCCCYSKSRVLL